MQRQADFTAPALDEIFRAQSIAIVGASPNRGTARNTLVRVVLKHGFPGRVYPVTPSHSEIEGLKAYKSLAELPETPDVALIITPAATVPGIIEECGAKGVRCAIVYSAGFEEVESGKEHARRLAEAARKHGIAVLGANGQGVWSVKAKTMLTFGGAAIALDSIQHAPIAVISQSGALAGAIGNHLQQSGLGCSYIVSVGNETCLDALDALGWIIEQEDVNAVALYVEGLNNAARLLPLAARARERNVQIVMLKAGRSASGQEATASHTGKIASRYGIYLDVLAQAGVIVVESLLEAMAALEVLTVLPPPRVSGDPKGGVSIMGSSGGAGALLADHADEFGVPLAEFSPDTAAKLETFLPEFARKANPVDLTGQIRAFPNLFRDTVAVLSTDPRTEAIVVQFASGGMRDLTENADAFKAAARDGLPVIISFAVNMASPEVRAEFMKEGILLSQDPSTTMRALRWIYDRKRMSASTLAERDETIGKRPAPVSWEDTMSFLEESGVTPAKWKVLRPGDKAAEICADMNWPLVVKVLPSDAEHKTELGLVKLRVQTAEDVDAHAAAFRAKLGKPDAGVLVQEMITDVVEVVLSSLRNTDFGPVLSIGSGGVAIELYRDVTYLALPVTPEQVGAALRKLKLWTLLEGFRGAPRADIDALIKAAVRFGHMILATPDLAEAEINPVMVRPAGKGLAAVDFLGTVSGKPNH
ncbi:MAG: acetate--CoA ligase family protein [Rhodopila sp.]|nr:acetate--CoA ligase family protein [Rhodopila sp.]